MKTDAGDVVLIAVGGGAFLVPQQLAGVREVVRLEHGGCANAVGAAIAQVSGEVDQVFTGIGRPAAIAEATRVARERAVSNGADPATLEVVEVEDLPLAYLPGELAAGAGARGGRCLRQTALTTDTRRPKD